MVGACKKDLDNETINLVNGFRARRARSKIYMTNARRRDLQGWSVFDKSFNAMCKLFRNVPT